MNKITLFSGWIAVVLSAGGLMSCRKEDPKKATVVAAQQVPLVPVLVAIRSDGLGYLPGASTPFTGEAVLPYPDMPWLVKQKERFTAGKRDGDKLELYKNGQTKALRRYEVGVPKHAASYYKNGQMKFEVNLNASDKAEGPHKRWHENGTLESTATIDVREQWHGELKEWTDAGVLRSHYVFRHGVLEKIIFETPEGAASRTNAGMELEQPAVQPPVADPVGD